MSPALEPLLKVEDLSRKFTSGIFKKTIIQAVDGVSFSIARGKTLALVGESGSGKTTLGRLVLHLLPPTSGRVAFKGQDLAVNNGNMRALRRSMQIIFQDADGSLNPAMRVKELLLEPSRVQNLPVADEKEFLDELMEMVNLTPDLLMRYPHELSGGQRQRVGIARAVSLNPEFIVADEPVASLDRSVQAQILALLRKIQKQREVSYLYISHDLKTVPLMAHSIAVMYMGGFTEYGRAEQILDNPMHPYTRLLFASTPGQHRWASFREKPKLAEPGRPLTSAKGCRFRNRCTKAAEICRQSIPDKKRVSDQHWIWCHFDQA